jgi:hypothetical protein
LFVRGITEAAEHDGVNPKHCAVAPKPPHWLPSPSSACVNALLAHVPCSPHCRSLMLRRPSVVMLAGQTVAFGVVGGCPVGL